MTTPAYLPNEDLINAFLAEGGYASIEDWAKDSDFYCNPISAEWYRIDDPGPWAEPVDIEGAIEGAMEACGFLDRMLP